MLACLLGLQSQHFAAFEGGRSQSGLPVGFVWVKEQVGPKSCCPAVRLTGLEGTVPFS